MSGLIFVQLTRPSGDAPNVLRLSAAQRRINAAGAAMVLRAIMGQPDPPEQLAEERQGLLACLLRRSMREARGAAQCAAVLEARGMPREAGEVRRYGACGFFGADRLRALARQAALTGTGGAMRARLLRWAAERCS